MPRPQDRWQHLPERYFDIAFDEYSRAHEANAVALPRDVRFLPLIAVPHFARTLHVSLDANGQGSHAVALSLARQAFECLTVMELSLVAGRRPAAVSRCKAWADGRSRVGELRKYLEKEVWADYAPGLWGRPWTEGMASLGKALQPYAHFSSELLQWGLSMVKNDFAPGQMLASVGRGSFDPDKAERVALLDAFLLWTLLRITSENSDLTQDGTFVEGTLKSELERTEWLDVGKDWGDQLLPHIWFRR